MATITGTKNSGEAKTDSRAAYRAAWRDHAAATQRLQQLEQAALKAHDECNAAYTAHDDAEHALRDARARSPHELVASFLDNGQAPVNQRLREAEAKVKHAAAKLDHCQELEAAIQDEITRAENAVTIKAIDLHSTYAAIVCNNPAFKELCADITHAWFRLRTLREVFSQIQSACHGYMPSDIQRANAHEPLEERIVFPIDTQLVQRWQRALKLLADDPDAEVAPE